ncbi:alpha/beta-hydrolase [Mycena amicta]|nr:alpha/beta-hydrolase [Mycena amicta]
MRAPKAYLLLLASLVAATQPSVTIKNGTLLGVDLPQNKQHLFLGIPYAQPPLGDLRLRPPRSINASFGQFDATQYGPHCWSAFTTGFDDNSGFNSSEDCLSLNIVRPYGASDGSPLPVLVWIHGGGLTESGSADFRFNGTYLVEASVANGHPMIFVSMNYRVASFGFLGGSELENEGSLNLGMRDQRLALHWVQENIARFGGDPRKVTVQGERAGGIALVAHLVAFSGRNDHLFHQAIIQSGTVPASYPPASLPIVEQTFNNLLTHSSCASTINATAEVKLSCVRALPVDEFRAAAVGVTGLLFDGDIVNVTSAFGAFRAGNWVKVPLLVGSNTDEGPTFAIPGANTTDEARSAMSPLITDPTQLDKLFELYPDIPALGSPFNTGDFQMDPVQNGIYLTPGTQNKRVSAMTGDIYMNAGPRLLGQLVSNEVPFYKYRFNHLPYDVTFGVSDFIAHFVEMAYVFNTQNDNTDFFRTNHGTATYLGPGAPIADRFLGMYMSRSWAAFVATGDPNNANLTSKIRWPKYSENAENMVWQTQGSIIEKDDYRQKQMEYIMSLLV